MRIVCSILVMAVVTYLIRMLPMTIFRKKIQSRFLQDFLYTVSAMPEWTQAASS